MTCRRRSIRQHMIFRSQRMASRRASTSSVGRRIYYEHNTRQTKNSWKILSQFLSKSFHHTAVGANNMKTLFVLQLLFSVASCFLAPNSPRKQNEVCMAPRFDKKLNKWIPISEDEGPSAGYPPVGSLLRHGPLPYLRRVFQPDEYEQAVLKFMAVDKCDRNTAQGNMDAYIR